MCTCVPIIFATPFGVDFRLAVVGLFVMGGRRPLAVAVAIVAVGSSIPAAAMPLSALLVPLAQVTSLLVPPAEVTSLLVPLISFLL